MAVLDQAADNQYFRAAFEMLWWLPLGLLAAALFFGVYAIYRLWEAENGEGAICHRCGGPLGAEKDGRYGEYRTCMNCGKNVSNRKYR